MTIMKICVPSLFRHKGDKVAKGHEGFSLANLCAFVSLWQMLFFAHGP